MRWRCSAPGEHLRCQLPPGHAGAHMAMMLLGKDTALVSWGMAEQPVRAQAEPDSFVEVVATPEYVVFEEEPVIEKPWERKKTASPGHRDFSGRARRREWTYNLYAAPDEGIHISWDMFGHEVPTLPTLDEIEEVWK